MNKILFSLAVFGLFAFANTASAQGMMGNFWNNTVPQSAQSQDLNNALQDIYKTQNIQSQSQVSCNKVIDDQFEKLGDAYMGIMAGNEQSHQAMENMMGGEGSATLRQAHMNMGRSYLGCWSNYNSGPIYMPMMLGSGGMMNGFNSGWNSNGWSGMMGGFYGNSWTGIITTALFWILLILGIVALVKWVRK